MQICGDNHEIRVHNHHAADWVTIECAGGTITMQPVHVRALAAALDAYEAAKPEPRTSTPMTAQPIPGPAAAIQDAELKRIAAEREASIRSIAGDDPHAEINIDKRKAGK